MSRIYYTIVLLWQPPRHYPSQPISTLSFSSCLLLPLSLPPTFFLRTIPVGAPPYTRRSEAHRVSPHEFVGGCVRVRYHLRDTFPGISACFRNDFVSFSNSQPEGVREIETRRKTAALLPSGIACTRRGREKGREREREKVIRLGM